MAGFISHRLMMLVLTLFVASLVVFWVLELLPGDAAQLLLGTEVQPDTLAAIRAQLGLDRPALLRYGDWIGGLLTGDLGDSLVYGIPIWDMVRDRLAVSLPLAVMAFIIA